MNYGLYLSASGMLTSLYKMDVVSNNLSNAQTPGFKSVVAATQARRPAGEQRDEEGQLVPAEFMMSRLGGGVRLMPNRLTMDQGTLQSTGRDLDLALEGRGFLVVSAASEGNPNAVRLTRDGRMAISAEGKLVHAASGRAMLDEGGNPITVRRDIPIRIDRTGLVRQGAVRLARLQVADLPDTSALAPAGDGLLVGPSALMETRDKAPANVVQRYVEGSSVDPVRAMVDFSAAERAVQVNSKMLQLHDQLLDRAINGLGRMG